MTTDTAPKAYQAYIGGQWVDAADGATFDVINPATEQVIATAPEATGEDLRRAIEAARAAFDEGPWPRMSRSERSRIIKQIADNLSTSRERMRELLTAEAGCTQFLMNIQLDDPLKFMHYYADLAKTFDPDEMLPPLTQDIGVGPVETSLLVHHQPAGVIAAINTWNFPLFVLLQKLGPALAAGCTLVVKTSPYAPLLNLEVARAVAESDLPEGVFNVITGESVELSRELVASPRIDKISFTGSVQTGKRIAEAAAANLTRVHLELGGKSPCILLEDADLDRAAPGLASPTFIHAGQGCALHTRCLVPAKLYDSVLERMVGFVRNLKIGNPSDPEVMVGPLIREERRAVVEDYVRIGREEGGTVATGGGRPKGDAGFFFQPTIFCDVDNSMRIVREEIFGPVVTVIPYRDLDEAVEISNDSPFGLSGRIVTQDHAKGVELAKRLRTGSVLISEGMGGPGSQTFMVAPFGGFKESGIGREGGKHGILEFSEIQSIAW